MTDAAADARRTLARALGLAAPASPFPWQLALLDRFLDDQLPEAIDVPTGLGKTAVMAIWLVARSARPSLPRRLVYVVDRRAVVDQATEEAEKLRGFVSADARFKQALEIRDELAISTLRGKHLDNRQWLSDPGTPALVIGTVDMVGSRLLFEGYGVSRKMRPYHAGLLGVDSLVVLDEAHLVPPFERLIETLSAGRDAAGRSLRTEAQLESVVPKLRFLSLSATGRARDNALTLSDADRANEIVSRRLTAVKRVVLRGELGTKDLPAALAEEAWALAHSRETPTRCLVFCDRRDDARKVQESLESRCKKAGTGETELLVGGRRLFEREEAANWLKERGFFAGERAEPTQSSFVIATAAGEVGVDLDADLMVSDVVAWERMVQRLGRVNRRGEGDATVILIPVAFDDADKKARLDAARSLLQRLPQREDGSLDASPGALTRLKAASIGDSALRDLMERASTPPELHPPLHRATVEAWSMTSLEEHTGRPEVAPWLRGWPHEEEEPQTAVAWREFLPITDDGSLLEPAALETFREAAEPHLAERLETETFRVVEWLDQRLKTLRQPEDGDAALAPHERPLRGTDVVAVLLDGRDEPRVVRGAELSNRDRREDLRRRLAGALLLVDARLGGLRRGLLDPADDNKATDVSALEGDLRRVPFRIQRVTRDFDESKSDVWRKEARVPVRKDDEEETAWLLIESLLRAPAESEEGRSAGANRAQELEAHESWAEESAARIARSLTLPEPHAEMLRVAARLHDEGKRAWRWQRAFGAEETGGPYAKTESRPNLQLLARYRHELGSLARAETHPRVQALEPSLRELCLHLIAAHHGFARPLLRTDSAEEPPTRLAERARQIALRFARLEQTWGPWGLAWWEALLRAADQEASRRNDEQGGER